MEGVGDIFAVVGSDFQQFVDLFQLDDADGILFVVEQLRNGGPRDLIGVVLQAIDLDAMGDDVIFLAERFESKLESFRARQNDFANLVDCQRGGLDAIRDHLVGHFFDAIKNVVQVRSERVNVFRVNRSDERLVQLLKNLMNDFVACPFQLRNFFCGFFHTIASALHQQHAGLRNQADLAKKIVIKLFFPGEKPHTASKNCVIYSRSEKHIVSHSRNDRSTSNPLRFAYNREQLLGSFLILKGIEIPYVEKARRLDIAHRGEETLLEAGMVFFKIRKEIAKTAPDGACFLRASTRYNRCSETLREFRSDVLSDEDERTNQTELFFARIGHWRQCAQTARKQGVAKERFAEVVRGVTECNDVRSQAASDFVDGATAKTAAKITAMIRLLFQQSHRRRIFKIVPVDSSFAQPNTQRLDGPQKFALLHSECAYGELNGSFLLQKQKSLQHCERIFAARERDGNAVAILQHVEASNRFADFSQQSLFDFQTSIIRSVIRFAACILFSSFAWAQCDTIPQVQGDGPRSPCVDSTVTVRGVVTASFGGMQGFFVEDPAGDGNAKTSDGIFVFAGTNRGLPEPRSIMSVTGKVVEFARSGYTGTVTELDIRNGGSFTVEGISSAAIHVPVLDARTDREAELERFEGMLILYPASMVLNPANRFGEFFALRNDRVPAGVRLFPFSFGVGLPLLIDTAGGVARKDPKTFDLVPDLIGVLHFDFGAYRLEPLENYSLDDAGLTPTAARSDAGTQLRVAFMNCERFLRSLAADVLETKRIKLAAAIRDQLGSPDIVGVAEVEDLELLESMGKLAGDYKGVLLKGCDFSGINVGVLYKTTRVRGFEATQLQTEAPEFRNGACTLPDGRKFSQFLFDRPPLLFDFAIGQTVYSIVVNHWRSRVGTTTNEEERIAEADFLGGEIAKLQRENLIVVGDFNDTETDVSLFTLVDRTGLTLLTGMVPPESRYSLLFEGVSQAIDHILLSPALAGSVIRVDYAHYNSDYPVTPNESQRNAVRAADHDAVYVNLK